MRKILLINRLGIGDVALTTPLARLIKEHNEAKIGFVVAAKAADILVNHTFIDDVFAYRKQDKQKVIGEIKEKGYNEAIIVDERFTSTLLAWQAGCRLLNKGFEISLGANRLFKRHLRKVRAMEDYADYIALINPGLTGYEVTVVLGSPDEARKQVLDDWLLQQQNMSAKLVLIAPKSAAINKNWPIAHFGEINIFLNKQGIIPVYIGSPGDAEYINQIVGQKTNAAGLFSLRELPFLAKHAAFAISVCTGPLHIMSSAKVPIIALYGPSDPVRWAPPGAVVLKGNLPCMPCERLDCTQTPGQTCMELITPEQVIHEILQQGWV